MTILQSLSLKRDYSPASSAPSKLRTLEPLGIGCVSQAVTTAHFARPSGQVLARRWVASGHPGPSPHNGGTGRVLKKYEMKPPRIDPALRELIGLSLIAGGGCGLALSQGEFLFVAVFGAACAVIIIEAMRRWGAR
jgi:hypothetical protein